MGKKGIKSQPQLEHKGDLHSFRNRYLLLGDLFYVLLSYGISLGLLTDHIETIPGFGMNHLMLISTMGIFATVLYIAGCYSVLWRYSATIDYLRILIACLIASLVNVLFNTIVFSMEYLKLNILAVMVLTGLIMFSRMAIRARKRMYKIKHSSSLPSKRLLVVGAGLAASIILRDIANNDNLNYEVIGFVDDDPSKRLARINGLVILGNRYDIPRICREYRVDEIVIAIPSASSADRRAIIQICSETPCKVKTLPSIDQIIDKQPIAIRNVQLEDLLERDPVVLDNREISEYIAGKIVLVTGGGGSIGSELCRQIMKFNPQKLVILDFYENNAYELQMELNHNYPDNKPDVVIASIRELLRLEQVFQQYRPDVVFHAAAHKHVPMMEESPGEAIKNNVFGTLNVAQCSHKYGVKRFVLISSDKAVNPTNVMGATKRICEMLLQGMQPNSNTKFAMVRFGNVLGSNGSVIPLFKKQIEQGGPVTVTDKRMTRFFMTIPEAAQLVLQAVSYAKGGEIFVLDMGEPVKIYDLARNMIKLSGYQPDVDIKIEFCGLRPGEKLYEELLMNEEGLEKTKNQKIFIGKPIEMKAIEMTAMLEDLRKATESDDPEYIKEVIEKVVHTYRRENRKECTESAESTAKMVV